MNQSPDCFAPSTTEWQDLYIRVVKLETDLTTGACGKVPPFPPHKYAELMGNVNVRRVDLGNVAGITIPLFDSYLVKVNAKHQPVRQNFTLAHELAHILIQEGSGVSRIGVTTRGPTKPTGRDLERLCDSVAAELLMPQDTFRKHLQVQGLSMNALDALSGRFETSREATAKRMSEVSDEPCLCVCWKLARQRGAITLPCSVWSTNRLDIQSRVATGVKVGSSVPANSSISSAFVQPEVTRGFEALQLGSTKKRVYVESKGLGQGEDRRVLSLVFPGGKEKL